MKTYTIKKGRHFSKNKIYELLHMGTTDKAMIFEFQLGQGWIYPFIKGQGWSKVCGFKKGLFGIHRNSARLGIKCRNWNTIILCTYCYIDGVRKISTFQDFNPEINQRYRCAIVETSDFYIFQLSYKKGAIITEKHIPRISHSGKDIQFIHSYKRFKSYPYFGGKFKALTDILTKIRGQ